MVGTLLLIASSAILVLNVVNSVSSPTTSASKACAATSSFSRSVGWCSVSTCSSRPSFSEDRLRSCQAAYAKARLGKEPNYTASWKQIPVLQKRDRPDISLRVHVSIRRQLKAG